MSDSFDLTLLDNDRCEVLADERRVYHSAASVGALRIAPDDFVELRERANGLDRLLDGVYRVEALCCERFKQRPCLVARRVSKVVLLGFVIFARRLNARAIFVVPRKQSLSRRALQLHNLSLCLQDRFPKNHCPIIPNTSSCRRAMWCASIEASVAQRSSRKFAYCHLKSIEMHWKEK